VTYPEGVSPNPNAVAGAQSDQTSPPKYPSPWGSGAGDWEAAYKKAIEVVKQLTLEEKVNLTTGMAPASIDSPMTANSSRYRVAARAMCWPNRWRASSGH
jgi:beta-glucosidase